MATNNGALVIVCVCLVGLLVGFVSGVASRAVNISNTWLLPEDNYPVFYRFFKDQISWFEADAVCQFHHARLVTVDTSEQFDASRAFLKELDVVQPVWLGLKSPEKPSSTADVSADHTFLWTNEVPLTGPGFWSQPPSAWLSPEHEFCAVTDPAADFRWTGLPCRGPHTAGFICEMPVPEWARSKDGCLLASLPSLSVAFLPEVDAIELTADCGLEGTRKVACKGQVNRDDMIKQLTCEAAKETDTLPSEDDDTGRTSSPAIISSSSSSYSSSPSPSSMSSSPFSTDDTSASSAWSSPASGNTIEPSSPRASTTWTSPDGTPTRMRRDTEASMATTPTSQPARPTEGHTSQTALPAQIVGIQTQTQAAQIIPVVPKKGLQLWTKKPEANKIDKSKPISVKNDVDDKEDLMILELSDTNTPLQTTKAPIVPLSPSTDKMRERLVTLVLPSTAESFKAKPVKKAAALVVTSTTSAPTTLTPTTEGTPTSSKPPARQFESMAGPGGKSRSLTTTTSTVASSDPTATTPVTTTLSDGASTTAPTTAPPTTTVKETPTTPTAAPTTIAATTPTPMTSTTTTSAPTTSADTTTASTPLTTPNRKRHLPGPLMPMSMKSIDFGEPSDSNAGTEAVPRSEDGEHSALVDDADTPSARPNRGRLLFRPHQHVFYPYFFNRALGR